MPKTSLHAFKMKDTRFVVDWLKSKGLHKLCSVFEGIQEPFTIFLACKRVVSRSIKPCLHTHLPEHNKSIWSPGMDLWWGIWTAFRAREGGNLDKHFPKIQMPGGLPGGRMLKLRFDWYIISARPQRQTNAEGCRIFWDLDQLKSKDTIQKPVD